MLKEFSEFRIPPPWLIGLRKTKLYQIGRTSVNLLSVLEVVKKYVLGGGHFNITFHIKSKSIPFCYFMKETETNQTL